MALFHGSRLRELRKNKNISIAELSKLSDVSTGLISQIEREMVIPSVVSIWRLAQALDTNINYFSTKTTSMTRSSSAETITAPSSSTVIAATTSCSVPLPRSACWI